MQILIDAEHNVNENPRNKFFLAIWNLIKSLLIFAIYMAQLLLTMDV